MEFMAINHPNELGSKTKFVTPTANGNMRDVLTVECPIMNGERFNGSITLKEAKDGIFVGKLKTVLLT